MAVAGSRFGMENEVEGRPMRVQRGLFVMRYASSSAGFDAPAVSIAPLHGSGVEILTLDAPAQEAVLAMPGDCIAIRSVQDSAVLVRILPRRHGGSQDAHVVLERIAASEGAPLSPAGYQGGHAGALPALSILAHVSRRGDILCEPGEWICGPQLPMAIEGIELRWPPASGVDILTSAVIGGRGRKQLPPAPAGSFVGTRGKAAPLVGLSCALSGPAANRYRLSCEALFLGAPVMSVSGPSISVAGPSGYEPLVGLKLSLSAAAAHGAEPYEARGSLVELPRLPLSAPVEPIAPLAASAATEMPTRIRVFRTSRQRGPNNSSF